SGRRSGVPPSPCASGAGFCTAACVRGKVLLGFWPAVSFGPPGHRHRHHTTVSRGKEHVWPHGRGIMQAASKGKKTPVTLLALSIGLAIQVQVMTAVAQDAAPVQDPQNLDAIMVTGYRASVERALDIKRGEKGVVDAIVAEDIGKFPDLNLAESLQRI